MSSASCNPHFFFFQARNTNNRVSLYCSSYFRPSLAISPSILIGCALATLFAMMMAALFVCGRFPSDRDLQEPVSIIYPQNVSSWIACLRHESQSPITTFAPGISNFIQFTWNDAWTTCRRKHLFSLENFRRGELHEHATSFAATLFSDELARKEQGGFISTSIRTFAVQRLGSAQYAPQPTQPHRIRYLNSDDSSHTASNNWQHHPWLSIPYH